MKSENISIIQQSGLKIRPHNRRIALFRHPGKRRQNQRNARIFHKPGGCGKKRYAAVSGEKLQIRLVADLKRTEGGPAPFNHGTDAVSYLEKFARIRLKSGISLIRVYKGSGPARRSSQERRDLNAELPGKRVKLFPADIPLSGLFLFLIPVVIFPDRRNAGFFQHRHHLPDFFRRIIIQQSFQSEEPIRNTGRRLEYGKADPLFSQIKFIKSAIQSQRRLQRLTLPLKHSGTDVFSAIIQQRVRQALRESSPLPRLDGQPRSLTRLRIELSDILWNISLRGKRRANTTYAKNTAFLHECKLLKNCFRTGRSNPGFPDRNVSASQSDRSRIH